MQMREYRAADLETVMSIADEAWRPIRQMSREALGDAVSIEFPARSQLEGAMRRCRALWIGEAHGIPLRDGRPSPSTFSVSVDEP